MSLRGGATLSQQTTLQLKYAGGIGACMHAADAQVGCILRRSLQSRGRRLLKTAAIRQISLKK